MIKLSIIVPLYNSEKFILKCLDSLLNQDIPHSEYEIIVVNDGSPDSSYEIVSSYKEKYSNIVLVSQENQGTSGARNTGIDIARGEFLTFVDPDDYVEKNVYCELILKMEKEKLDMLRFDFTIVDEDYNTLPKPKGAKGTADYSTGIVEGKVFLAYKLGYACFVWAYIYRTSLLKDNLLYYKTGFYIDDIEWLPRVLICAQKVTSLSKNVVYYVQHKGSLMNTFASSSTIKKLDGCFAGIEMLMSESQKHADTIAVNWYRGMISVTVITILQILSTVKIEKKKNYMTKLEEYKLYPISDYGHSKHLKRKIHLVNISPKLYILITSIRNIL
jgi:glycosyltransferase involved in cell wall biosynthesis